MRNAKRFSVMATVILCSLWNVALGQRVPSSVEELEQFFAPLAKPIRQVKFDAAGPPARNRVWENQAIGTSQTLTRAQLEQVVTEARSIPNQPGTITAMAGDGALHVFAPAQASTAAQPPSVPAPVTPPPATVVPAAPPAPAAPAVPPQPLVAPTANCASDARAWFGGLPNPVAARLDNVVLVFDENGAICAHLHGRATSASPERPQRITQGDLIYVGVYGRQSVVETLRRTIPTCSLESTAPNVMDSTFTTQSGGVEPQGLKRFTAVECFDDEISIEIRRANNVVAFSETVRQYKRFRGTVQIGAVWTELDDPTYSLRDSGNGSVIQSDIDDSQGPQYVGSVVVYGLPNYFNGNDEPRYSGRDIVNENTIRDRIGLALSLGLDEPKDTFGIGLAFEVATGVNLTVTKLYRRLNLLDGVAEGDVFTGTDNQLPLQKTWKDDTVFGISIDGRYFRRFFSGDTKE